MNALSYRPKGDIFQHFKITKISRYARNDKIMKPLLKHL